MCACMGRGRKRLLSHVAAARQGTCKKPARHVTKAGVKNAQRHAWHTMQAGAGHANVYVGAVRGSSSV